MSARTDMNRVAVAVAIIVAMLAFLVPPLCELSACGMPSGMMHSMHDLGTSVECGMSAAYSATTAGVIPTRLDLGALLGAMLFVALMGFGPSGDRSQVRAGDGSFGCTATGSSRNPTADLELLCDRPRARTRAGRCARTPKCMRPLCSRGGSLVRAIHIYVRPGLVTSVHCISMCGPMVVTYAVRGDDASPWHSKLVPSLAYQGAKITSYVAIGLMLGAVGSAFSVDGIRPYVMAAAGAFMIVMGLGMTGRVPWAARLVPHAPRFLTAALSTTRHKASADAQVGESSIAAPITFGLLTGLMPCAPLIAAELAAAGSGSVASGGIAMLAFGLGTAPLMLAFGTASSLLGRTLRDRVMVVLAVVVILFGVVYLDRAAMRLGSPVTLASGWQALTGAPQTGGQPAAAYTTAADGVVEVPLIIRETQFVPQTVEIPADMPVRLVVDAAKTLRVQPVALPQLGVLQDLTPNGTTVVDFRHAGGNVHAHVRYGNDVWSAECGSGRCIRRQFAVAMGAGRASRRSWSAVAEQAGARKKPAHLRNAVRVEIVYAP